MKGNLSPTEKTKFLSFILCDGGDNTIVIFDKKGNFIKKFGRKGQGPGDLSRPTKITVFNNNLLVYDSSNYRFQVFTLDGEFIKAYRAFSLSEFGAKMWITKNGNYYVSTEGYNSENLIIQRSLNGKIKGRYGKTYGKKQNVYVFETNLVKKGIVPNSYKNKVFPVADKDNFVYCIHSALPIIKKYDSLNNLIWKRELNLPHLDLIKKNWIEINKRNTRPNMSIQLIYWKDIEMDEFGNIYLLANIPNRMIVYCMNTNGDILAYFSGVMDNISMISIHKNEMWAFGRDSQIFYKYFLKTMK